MPASSVPVGGFPPAPKRRLSPWRVSVALLLLVGAVCGTAAFVRHTEASQHSSVNAWYAPYVDVTLTPSFAFEDGTVNPSDDVVLSFVVASPTDACTPTWGGAYTLDEAATALDLDRRVALYRQNGGDVVVSFGGALRDELATSCDDADALARAYRDVIDRYGVTTIDLDIEANDLADTEAAGRRAVAIADVQQERRASGGSLAVWLTLPVTAGGLPAEAVGVVDAMLGADVDVAGVNVMTMNFGESRDAKQSMAEATANAVAATSRQLLSAYQRADQRLSLDQVQAKIGVTPMLGQNDDADDVFTLDDAEAVVQLVGDSRLGRLSMWSLNRDFPCGPNVPVSREPSDHCTGLDQEPFEFSRIFDEVDGRPAGSAGATTMPLEGGPVIDDPATAPYPIWREDRGYEQGDKVVWHGYVYQAKWFNEGEAPDTPIVNEWETPWTLVGPVLATDEPLAPTPTVAPDTYPAWAGQEIYEEGDRVEFRGYGYEAKWWTQGDQPGIDVPNEWDTPWELITD